MKKTITRPDGTVEVFEGTLEELQKLEEAQKRVAPKKSRKKLLNEEETRRIAREEIAAAPKPAPTIVPMPVVIEREPICPRRHYPWWTEPVQPYWISPNIWIGDTTNILKDGHDLIIGDLPGVSSAQGTWTDNKFDLASKLMMGGTVGSIGEQRFSCQSNGSSVHLQ